MLQIILDTVTCCYRLHSDVQEEDGQVGAESQHPQHTQVDGADYEHLELTKLEQELTKFQFSSQACFAKY